MQTPQQEVSVFDADEEFRQYERELHLRAVRQARNTLFIVGALTFLVEVGFIFYYQEQFDLMRIYITLGIDLTILAGFVGLGFWTKTKPFLAILCGLILYLLIQVIAAVNDPSTLYKGLILKGIVIGLLISGLKKARALQYLDRYPV
jgi:hypothetical protein